MSITKKLNVVKRFKNLMNLTEPVEDKRRFIVSELLRRSGKSGYKLEGSSVKVYLRHGTADLETFTQVFLEGHYQLSQKNCQSLVSQERPVKIVDLGGNIGLFSAKMLVTFPSSSITIFEPDPKSLQVLQQFVHGNRDYSIEVVPACASSSDGSTPFFIGRDGVSRLPDKNERVEIGSELVKQVDVFRYLKDADFLKVDIEGGEWNILQDPRFKELNIPIIVLEYHTNLCPTENPERLAREVLETAGYTVSSEDFLAPKDHGVLWGTK